MKLNSYNSQIFLSKNQTNAKVTDKAISNSVSVPSFKSNNVQYARPVFAINNNRSQVAFGRRVIPVEEALAEAHRVLKAAGKAITESNVKEYLGGKPYGLAEMSAIKLPNGEHIPVPAAIILPTDVCHEYQATHADIASRFLPQGLMDEVMQGVSHIESKMGKKFGDAQNPLLVSVRSGAPVSMPGMMDTILNVGLNDETVKGLTKTSGGNERFALDSYRRLIQMFGKTVKDVDSKLFEDELGRIKDKHGLVRDEHGFSDDSKLNAEGMREVVAAFKQVYHKATGEAFPQDVNQQLEMSVKTVFNSWDSNRAVTYRKINDIPAHYGTSVTVQSMAFGNMGEDCATGVAFTRDNSTGENIFLGEFLVNAQGEDVVAGTRTPLKMPELGKQPLLKNAADDLEIVRHTLEKHFGYPQDLEFTVEKGKLYMLQTRNAKATVAATMRILHDMAMEGTITKEQAIAKVPVNDVEKLLYPVFDEKDKKVAIAQSRFLAKGIGCTGCAKGEIVFTPEDAEIEKAKGKEVILVREETSPEDIAGMHAAKGILTARGGETSHAAVVAKGMNKACVVGCGALHIDAKAGILKVNGKEFKKGDLISIDGNTGEIFAGPIVTIDPRVSDELKTMLGWARDISKLKVKANADSPEDVERAVKEFGAQGVGLARTEHMFFEKTRIGTVRDMLLADTTTERVHHLDKLLPMQREDFEGIFRALKGSPARIRLLDPPANEFLPDPRALLREVVTLEIHGHNPALLAEKTKLLQKVEAMTPSDPMMAIRGCRLGITYPEITEMQTRALFEAACNVKLQRIEVKPEVMIPNVSLVGEFAHQKAIVDRIAQQVMLEKGVNIKYTVGTMIEIPSAALASDRLAEAGAEFFSAGTNDLTQATMLAGRNDIGPYHAALQQHGILEVSPFTTLDDTVAELLEVGVKRANKGRTTPVEFGVCGEHGGDPASIAKCLKAGLTSISCSTPRIPTATFAAAQATIKQRPKTK